MQKGPSQVSTGNITPALIGQQKDTKEVMILAGLVVVLAGLIAAAWYYGLMTDQVRLRSAPDKIDNVSMSEVFKKGGVLNQAEASTTLSTLMTAPIGTTPDIIHSDIYFEVGRKGLTDEAKGALAAQANILKQHEDYGVLIQGYTDQQGSAGYNLKLGMKRAETVQAELLAAGIPAHRIKAVSLGEAGVLCIDTSDVCRHMNRRVHLDIRKIGHEHMIPPALPAAINPSDPMLLPTHSEKTDSITESLPPAPSDATEPPTDLTSGS